LVDNISDSTKMRGATIRFKFLVGVGVPRSLLNIECFKFLMMM